MPSLIEIKRERDWRRYARDELRFFEECVTIRHPEKGSIPLILRDAQAETLEVWNSNRLSLTLKSRQIGFSTLVAAHVLWIALFEPDRYVILLSKGEREAGKLVEKVKYAYERLPEWIRHRVPRTNRSEFKMTFANGSIIESLPASTPARGDAAYLIVVDEWAFFEDPEAAWASIEPAADIGGRIIALSTANGWGNLFHSMWVAAETRNSAFVPVFHGWDAVPERNQDWYESKQREFLGREHILHQEYPRNPDEAFSKSGNPVFDIDYLRSLPTDVEWWRGSLHHVNSLKNFEARSEDQGPLRVWEQPVPDRKYAIGADIAEGLEWGDYSSAHVIDATTGVVVAVWHGHIDADLFGLELAKLGWYYNYALVGPEVNNHGLTTVKALQRAGYRNIYRTRALANRKERKVEQYGWRTQKNTKPLAIDELWQAVRNGTLVILDELTIAEMKTYVRDEKGGMSGSPFDDRVMSLAIAEQMRKWVYDAQYAQHMDDYWTLDWWARQGDEARIKGQDFVIGAQSLRS